MTKFTKFVRFASIPLLALGVAVALSTPDVSDPVEADGGARHRGDRHAAGDALPGLSSDLQDLFDEGRDAFFHEYTAAEGLGPIYNERACQTCHGGLSGAAGGPDPNGVGSEFDVTHFGYDNQGYYDPLRDLGGPIIQHRDISDVAPGCTLTGETVPAQANVISRRHTPAVWGFGLIDAIPDQEILRNQAIGRDGVNGVANWGREMQARAAGPTAADPQLHVRGQVRVGRFGWKSQTATIAQFTAEPFNLELGITNPFFPQEFTASGLRFGHELPAGCDVADSIPNDDDEEDSLALYHFQALVAPPPRLPIRGQARAGEVLFERIGCANCHTPTLRTAPVYRLRTDSGFVRVPQLENQDVHLYSDLLTHDMGDLLADDGGTTIGRVMGRADGRRWRTTPLWGLRFKNALLHDGRTASVEEAILAHGGEAQNARDRFASLPASRQRHLLTFLQRL